MTMLSNSRKDHPSENVRSGGVLSLQRRGGRVFRHLFIQLLSPGDLHPTFCCSHVGDITRELNDIDGYAQNSFNVVQGEAITVLSERPSTDRLFQDCLFSLVEA
jgi:hypothetical protein